MVKQPGKRTSKPGSKATAGMAPDTGGMIGNERVLAQWCQTSILLQASGFALTQFGDSALRGPVGTLLIMTGAFVAVTAYQRYVRFDQWLRGQRDGPWDDRRPFTLVAVISGIAVVMAGLQIAGIW